MKVAIVMKSLNFDERNAPADRIEVLVDDVYLGGGDYGGEPEDNSRHRDYHWVEQLIEKLAEKLGADVKKVKMKGLSEEDFYR